MGTEHKIVRRRGACNRCKRKKTRCNGLMPYCSNCKDPAECVYEVTSRKRQSDDALDTNNERAERVGQSVEKLSYGSLAETSQTCSYSDIGIESNVQTGHDSYLQDVSPLDNGLFHMPLPVPENFFGDPWEFSAEDLSNLHTTSTGLLVDTTTGLPESIVGVRLRSAISWGTSQNVFENAMWEKILLENANELFASPFVAKLRTYVDHIEDFFREPFELGSDFVLQHSRRNASFAPSQLKSDIVDPIMLQYIEEFFKMTISEYPIISKLEVLCILERAVSDDDSTNIDDDIKAFIYAMMAISAHTIANRPSFSIDSVPDKSLNYFSAALLKAASFQQGSATILTLQALICMALYASQMLFFTLYDSLISQAVQHALALGLNDRGKIHSRFGITLEGSSNPDYEHQLFRIFLVLYNLEKPLALRKGRQSAIDDDFITYNFDNYPYTDESIFTASYKHLALSCRFSRICFLALRNIYSTSATSKPPEERTVAKRDLRKSVDNWKCVLLSSSSSEKQSSSTTSATNVDMHNIGSDSPQRSSLNEMLKCTDSEVMDDQGRIYQMVRFYEMCFAISDDMSEILDISRAVIRLSKFLGPDRMDVMWLRTFIYAYTVLIIHKNRHGAQRADGDDTLSAIACGIFARLSHYTLGRFEYAKFTALAENVSPTTGGDWGLGWGFE